MDTHIAQLALVEALRAATDRGLVSWASVPDDDRDPWAVRCRLEPVKKVARLCKRHLPNLITFFEHRLTNGPMEGLNNAIQGLIKKAFGYRNKERFKTDIFFHFGGLDLYPAQ